MRPATRLAPYAAIRQQQESDAPAAGRTRGGLCYRSQIRGEALSLLVNWRMGIDASRRFTIPPTGGL